jgi:hypothetical protein
LPCGARSGVSRVVRQGAGENFVQIRRDCEVVNRESGESEEDPNEVHCRQSEVSGFGTDGLF